VGLGGSGGPRDVDVSPGSGQPDVFGPGLVDVILTEVDLLPNPLSVAVGASGQLNLTGLTDQGDEVALPGNTTASVSYATDSPGIATVNSAGQVTGVSQGSAIVTATVVNDGSTLTATTTVLVTAGGSGATIAHIYVSNPTPNSGGGSVTSVAVAPDGMLSVIENNTEVNRPLSIAATPSGEFLYAVNIFGLDSGGLSNFSVFLRDQASGVLTFDGTDPTALAQTNPQVMAIDPTGRFAYVLNFAGDAFAYLIGPDGHLSENTASTTVDTGSNGVTYPVFNSAGDRFYVPDRGDDTITIIDVDTGDGAITLQNDFVVTSGDSPYALEFDPSDAFLYSANINSGSVSSYSVDANGDLALVDNLPTNVGPRALSVHPTIPVLYVAGGDNTVVTVELDGTGGLSILGTSQPTGVVPNAILVDPTGSFVYIVCSGFSPAPATISAYQVDQTDGSLTFLQDYNFPELSFSQNAVLIPVP
jgi:6-phosphogluconolactonase (cycloisomerase 2 family)